MPGQGTEGEIAGGPREPTSAAIAEPFRASLVTVLRQWGRIGCTGFGGPPTHIKMLRDLCVDREGWLDAVEFEDAVDACNLLTGPASTELAIFCAWRVRGRLGALVGGVAFIVPGLIVILALAAVFLSGSPPRWVLGAGAGAGAAVAAVAVQAAWSLTPASSVEAGIRHVYRDHAAAHGVVTVPLLAAGTISGGVLLSVAWVAFKVGALSFGGGFVIIPLMQADAVSHYHWMTGGQFLNAVALGQITPGPVVQTVAFVGYAAAGIPGGLLASAVAFSPSFAFILLGARRFDRLRGNQQARAFLDGAGPAAIGAILGPAITLTRAITQPWQHAILAAAAILLLVLRRGVVLALLMAAAGILIALAGGPLPA